MLGGNKSVRTDNVGFGADTAAAGGGLGVGWDVDFDAGRFCAIKSFASSVVLNFLKIAPANPFTCASHSVLRKPKKKKNERTKINIKQKEMKRKHIKIIYQVLNTPTFRP